MSSRTSNSHDKTTSEEIAKDFASHARDQQVLITGASSGIGYETAKCLVKVGAKVTITSRTKQKLEKTISSLKENNLDAQVHGILLELSSLESVRACADEYIKSGKTLNILINNAGTFADDDLQQRTEDGFEAQLLMPLLQAAAARGETARVVNLSSAANVLAPSHGISLHDLGAHLDYDPVARQGESRLASILHAKEISRRYAADGVVAVAVNPAAAPPTPHGRCFGGLGRMARHLLSSSAAASTSTAASQACSSAAGAPLPPRNPAGHALQKGTLQAASTALLAALGHEVVPGGYYADCRPDPGPRHLHHRAHDAGLAHRLWEMSEAAVRPLADAAEAVAEAVADATSTVALSTSPTGMQGSLLSPASPRSGLRSGEHHRRASGPHPKPTSAL